MLPASLKMMLRALPWLGAMPLGGLPTFEEGAACGGSWCGFPECYMLVHGEQLQKAVGFAQNPQRDVKT